MARISIITISYNSEKTIGRTIESVLKQTFTDYEYIIIDGASNDMTLDVVNSYRDLFNGRFHFVSEPDKGIYDAMNKGIKLATGDIIGIVNSDDWLEPDALKNINEAFKNNEFDLNTLYCGSINYHWNGNVKQWNVDINKFKNQAKLYVMSGIRHPGVFVPKNIYETVGVFDDEMKLSADQDFILRCYFNGVKFLDIKKVVSNMSDGGISTNGSPKSRQYSICDRKRMLMKFKKTGWAYYWLYYSWKLRVMIKDFVVAIGLYKVG